MNISPEMLAAQAESTGFRPDVLEKVGLLLQLLDAIRSHPFLKGKLILKGGTALNLFIFDVPRLSIDIDLNYVGAVKIEAMRAERPGIEQALQAVFSREGFTVRRMPAEHAGGKWQLRYTNMGRQGGNLEVDVNFMFRIPLWPVKIMDSQPVGIWRAVGIPVLDIHELAAGKLVALFARQQARDLLDCSHLFRLGGLDWERLRITFVAYGAMSRKDWRAVGIEDITLDAADFDQKLLPMLRVKGPGTVPSALGQELLESCRSGLKKLLPFNAAETEFLNRILDKGEVTPDLLTTDENLQNRIRNHPLLEWKALNVREHKKIY